MACFSHDTARVSSSSVHVYTFLVFISLQPLPSSQHRLHETVFMEVWLNPVHTASKHDLFIILLFSCTSICPTESFSFFRLTLILALCFSSFLLCRSRLSFVCQFQSSVLSLISPTHPSCLCPLLLVPLVCHQFGRYFSSFFLVAAVNK